VRRRAQTVAGVNEQNLQIKESKTREFLPRFLDSFLADFLAHGCFGGLSAAFNWNKGKTPVI